MKKWSSFNVKSPTEITYNGSFPMGHDRKLVIIMRDRC